MFKYHSDTGHCFSYIVVVSKKILFVIGKTNMVLGKRWIFSIWNVAKVRPVEKGRKCLGSMNVNVHTNQDGDP